MTPLEKEPRVSTRLAWCFALAVGRGHPSPSPMQQPHHQIGVGVSGWVVVLLRGGKEGVPCFCAWLSGTADSQFSTRDSAPFPKQPASQLAWTSAPQPAARGGSEGREGESIRVRGAGGRKGVLLQCPLPPPNQAPCSAASQPLTQAWELGEPHLPRDHPTNGGSGQGKAVTLCLSFLSRRCTSPLLQWLFLSASASLGS